MSYLQADLILNGHIHRVHFWTRGVSLCWNYPKFITGEWPRSHGNENWEFDENGCLAKRYASINDQPITEADRKFRWERA